MGVESQSRRTCWGPSLLEPVSRISNGAKKLLLHFWHILPSLRECSWLMVSQEGRKEEDDWTIYSGPKHVIFFSSPKGWIQKMVSNQLSAHVITPVCGIFRRFRSCREVRFDFFPHRRTVKIAEMVAYSHRKFDAVITMIRKIFVCYLWSAINLSEENFIFVVRFRLPKNTGSGKALSTPRNLNPVVAIWVWTLSKQLENFGVSMSPP